MSFKSPQPISQIKSLDLETKCPCGQDLKLQIKKPAYFKPEITKSACPKCKSIFLIQTKVGKGRQVDVELGIQELSPQCEKVLQGIIDERSKKKAKRLIEGGASDPLEEPSGPKGA